MKEKYDDKMLLYRTIWRALKRHCFSSFFLLIESSVFLAHNLLASISSREWHYSIRHRHVVSDKRAKSDNLIKLMSRSQKEKGNEENNASERDEERKANRLGAHSSRTRSLSFKYNLMTAAMKLMS